MGATMELAARRQATERADREGAACLIYRREGTWYVRTEEEGAPPGAELVDRIEPWRKGS